VKDYDEAIQFLTQKLRFELVEDTQLEHAERSLRQPLGSPGTQLAVAAGRLVPSA
jgi:hypothetical protein